MFLTIFGTHFATSGCYLSHSSCIDKSKYISNTSLKYPTESNFYSLVFGLTRGPWDWKPNAHTVDWELHPGTEVHSTGEEPLRHLLHPDLHF